MNFKEWLIKETLKFSDAPKVQSKLTDYNPGTFGIEIEFVPTRKINEERAKRSWEIYKRTILKTRFENSPECKYSPTRWEDNNPYGMPNLTTWQKEYALNQMEFDKEFAKWVDGLNWRDYLNKETFMEPISMTEDIERVGEIFENMGEEWVEGNATPTEWGIGEDHALLEIRSKYLTVKDIPKLRRILEKLKDTVETTGGTSAHVHVGLQQFENFNMVDLLAIVTLIDENKMYQLAGPTRESRWAQPKERVADYLLNQIKQHDLLYDTKEEIIDNSTLKEIIKKIESKYLGANITSFTKIGTIEFRYLSSLVLNQIDEFIETIQYFLMIPAIARKKDSVKLVTSGNEPIYFTRMPNNQVKISTTPTRKSGESIDFTRSELPLTKFQQRKKEIKSSGKRLTDLERAKIWRIEDSIHNNNIDEIHRIIYQNNDIDIGNLLQIFVSAGQVANFRVIRYIVDRYHHLLSTSTSRIKAAIEAAAALENFELVKYLVESFGKDKITNKAIHIAHELGDTIMYSYLMEMMPR
jgi:hypothetical protein